MNTKYFLVLLNTFVVLLSNSCLVGKMPQKSSVEFNWSDSRPDGNDVDNSASPGGGNESTENDSDSDVDSQNLEEKFSTFISMNCMSCHNASVQLGGVNFDQDAQGLIDSGLLIPGDADNSLMFYVVKGAGVFPSLEKMPSVNAPNFPAEDIDNLRNYINSLAADTTPPPAPSFSHSSQVFIESFALLLSNQETNAEIRYSLDNSNPDCSNGLVYQGPIQIANIDITVKAVACDSSGNLSNMGVAHFDFVGEKPEPPIIVQESQAYNSSLLIEVSSMHTVRYTLDNSDPDCSDNGQNYNSGVILSEQTVNFKAVACSQYGVASDVVIKTFTFDDIPPMAPSITPGSITFSESFNAVITSSEPGTEIKYQNGINLDLNCDNGLLYSSAISVSAGASFELSAVACDSAGNHSEVTTVTYQYQVDSLSPPVITPESSDFNSDFELAVSSTHEVRYMAGATSISSCNEGDVLTTGMKLSEVFNLSTGVTPLLHEAMESSSGSGETTPTVVTGVEGNALSFDGVNDYIDLGEPEFVFNNYFEVSAHINPTSMSTRSNDMRIVSRATSTAEQDHIFMLSERLGKLRGRLKVNGTTYTVITADLIPLNQWTKVSMSFDGQAIKLMMDDVVKGELSVVGSVSSGAGVPLFIGASPVSLDNNFHGLIDEVKIYNEPPNASSSASFVENNEYKVSAVACNGTTQSSVVEKIYKYDTIAPPTPVADISSTTFGNSISVQLSSNEGYIRYSLDNSDPVTCSDGLLYIGPITITTTSTLKAVACDNAGNKSSQMQEVYTQDNTPPNLQVFVPTAGQEVIDRIGLNGSCQPLIPIIYKVTQAGQLIESSQINCTDGHFTDFKTTSLIGDGPFDITLTQTNQLNLSTNINLSLIKTSSPTTFAKFDGYACNTPNSVQLPTPKMLKRKSAEEIENKILDASKYLISGINIGELHSALQPELDGLEKNHHEKMDAFDQTISASHIDGYHNLFTKYINYLSSNQYFNLLNGGSTCLSAISVSDLCLNNFILRISPYFLEKKLYTEDLTFYRELYRNAPAGNRESSLVYTMLMSSSSIFHQYYDNSYIEGTNTIELTDLELAFKISYTLWKSIPDQQLLELATDNRLSAELDQELNRLMNHDHFKRGLKSFANNWLKLDHMQEIATNLPAVQEKIELLAANNINITDTSLLKKEVQAEATDFFSWIVQTDKSYEDLLLSPRTFNQSQQLSEIYQTPVWNGDLNTQVNLPVGKRAGLFTRAFNTWSYYATHSPISIGKRVLFDYVCGSIGSPPDNTDPPGTALFHQDMTAREYTKELTEQPGTSCINCHANNTQLNGKGFVFGEFGSFGERYIDTTSGEVVYESADLGGSYRLTRDDITTNSIVKISPQDNREVKNAIDMSFHILETGKGHACLSKKYFEYIRGTEANTALQSDSCTINKGLAALKGPNQGSIKNMIKAFINSPEFKMDTKTSNNP